MADPVTDERSRRDLLPATPAGTYKRMDFQVDTAADNPLRRYAPASYTMLTRGGQERKRTGFGAVAGMRDSFGRPLYTGNQRFRAMHARGLSEDARDDTMYRLGAAARNNYEEGGIFNKVVDNPYLSSGTGAVLGGGAAALAAWIASKFGMGFLSPETAAFIGAGIGGATGWKANRVATGKDSLPDLSAATAKLQNTAMQGIAGRMKSGSVQKEASMYRDPRNFILDKLQRDTTLSMADKAVLAGKVRDMTLESASALERDVRSACGIGVGALIANYFGLGLGGMLLGAGLGALAFNSMGFGGDAFASTRQQSFIPAFQQGGEGFDTYNEFLKSVF